MRWIANRCASQTAHRGLNASTVLETAVVAYEPLENHGGIGTNVLLGDGHVEFYDKQSWLRTATAAGVPVVPSLTTRQ
jgi:prepilin-type processing-associated H-X9-DG protein